MKKSFLDRAAAFVVAFVMMVGGVSALPEECFSLIGSVVRAEEVVASGKCGENVFWGLDSDGTLTISGSGDMYDYTRALNVPWNNYSNDIKKVTIENGITSISSYAFSGCLWMDDISIPNGVTMIGEYAFYNCSSLSSVLIPDSVIELGDRAFSFSQCLSSIKLSKNITKISSDLFWDCEQLDNVVIPESVTIIDSGAFRNCSSLTNISIPSSVNVINSAAFADTNITNINLPNNLIEIDDSLFRGCTNLSEITLPDSVVKIDHEAFWCCFSLNEIIIPSKVDFIGFDAFRNCPSLSKVTIYNKKVNFGIKTSGDQKYSPFNDSNNVTLYGYKNSTTEELAQEYGIPFVALDESDSEVSEDDLLKLIEQKSKTTVLKYIYIDMDKDGNKEILAAVENNLFSYEIWYCSSDGLKCNAVTSIGRGSDYANFLSIDYGTEEHIIFNCGNNFGNSQDYAVFALYDGTVEIPLKSAGVASITDKDTISVYMHGYDEDGVAVDEESEYKYDFVKRQYNKVSTGDSDTYIVTWVNEDGIPICAYETEYGVSPEFDFDTWGIPSNGNGDRFTGWSTNPDDIIAVFYDKSEYKGQSGDITYYAIFDDKVNVKWYNGKTLLKTDVCKKNTIPEFTGETPKCHDDEIGLVREFRGWTTSDNSNYDISIPIVLDPVTQNTVYYAVFDEDNAEYDPSDNIDIYDVDYINQHIESAKRGEWKFVHTSADLKNAVENPSLEISHGVWKTITIVDKTVNLDYMGIYGEISANDYNMILLDMFNSVEGYERASSIISESEIEGIKDWFEIILGCSKTAFAEDLKLNEEINDAYEEFGRNGNLKQMTEKISEIFSRKGISKDFKIDQKILLTYKAESDVYNILDTAASTLEDLIKNVETIVAYRTYCNMTDEYISLLKEMYNEANKISGNSWEVNDLKNAIRYSLYYYSNPDMETFIGMVNSIAKNAVKLGASDLIDEILEDQTVDFIRYTEQFLTGSDKPLHSGETVSAYFKAIQSGFKYGVKISDKLFDMNNRDECYVKIKEYGVLSEVLSNVLEDRANELLSASTLESQSSAAKYYDKAYKMYMFTEAAALTNAAEYEKTHEITESLKACIELDKKLGLYNFIDEWIEKEATRHVETAAKFSAFAEYINKNLKCHKDYVIGESKYADILITYNNLKPHKVAIISCPVTVRVYDENHILVGTLSSENASVKQGYEIYMYRVDETDSNVVCVPNDYTIEIEGLENGTMSVVASYFNSNEQVKTESYHNVPITSDYKATLEINEKTLDLITDTTIPTPTPDPTPNQIPTIDTTPSSPSFSKEPVITSGKSHTRQKLTLKTETSPDSIRLSWNKISGAKKYTVYIYRNGRYEKLKDTAGTSFVFKKPVHGKTYRFLVRYSANGRLSAEMFSGKVTVTVYLKPVVTAYSGRNSIKLSWKPVSGAEKYAVYRYKNGRGSKIYETENTYAVIKNLKSGAKYSYVVRAYVGGKWTPMTRSDIVTATAE